VELDSIRAIKGLRVAWRTQGPCKAALPFVESRVQGQGCVHLATELLCELTSWFRINNVSGLSADQHLALLSLHDARCPATRLPFDKYESRYRLQEYDHPNQLRACGILRLIDCSGVPFQTLQTRSLRIECSCKHLSFWPEATHWPIPRSCHCPSLIPGFANKRPPSRRCLCGLRPRCFAHWSRLIPPPFPSYLYKADPPPGLCLHRRRDRDLAEKFVPGDSRRSFGRCALVSSCLEQGLLFSLWQELRP